MSSYLSKSDFKVARTCPTKLYYKKLGYPSANDENEYLEFLADGGYMIETIAKLLHPDGKEIGFEDGPDASAMATLEALRQENVTLFEATLLSGGKLARVDILIKRGNCFDLIEVKAKSIDSSTGRDFFRGKRGQISPGWQPYLEDVGFQTLVLRELSPGAEIRPCLCLVDKSKTTSIDTIFSEFELKPRNKEEGTKFSRPEVRFVGDVEKLRADHLLCTVDVRKEVEELMSEILTATDGFLQSLKNGPAKIPAPIGVICRGCEYRSAGTEDGRDGFAECWGPLAREEPNILDYYQAGRIRSGGQSLIDLLVRKGRARLSDVEESDLVKSNGEVGAVAARQRIQREYTLANKEYFAPGLARVLSRCPYPLHFIDFETSRVAVPYHQGMRPYEQVAFQWSCHTIAREGEPPKHSEWINVTDAYPNFDFARSLMEQLAEGGTIFTWSHHENSVLKDIENQMDRYGWKDAPLARWLNLVVKHSPGDDSPIVDLCKVAGENYFHPRMKGRLSIKFVLPAVWEEDAGLRELSCFKKYVGRDDAGVLLNPYQTLPPLPFKDAELEEESDEVITEGGGAMRAYQEMLYGLSKYDESRKAQWKQLLLQYCELDTAAMVMIWMHWKRAGGPAV